MKYKSFRKAIIEYAISLHKDRLTVANSGNISVRTDDGFLITPSGVLYETLSAKDIVELDDNGNKLEGHYSPSSEWRIHKDIYKNFPDAQSIVHTHSPFATALSSHRKSIPPFHYMICLIGGNQIPCSPYANFGTQELSDNITQTLGSLYKACLMSNHGMVAMGSNLDTAYRMTQIVESLCEQYYYAKLSGDIVMLSDKEIEDARISFQNYGPGKS